MVDIRGMPNGKAEDVTEKRVPYATYSAVSLALISSVNVKKECMTMNAR